MIRNIKGVAILTDGNMKRMPITYDEIDDTGTVTKSNVKINKIVTDENVLEAISVIETYAQTIVDAE